MKNQAEFKTRKALFIDECRITDFEWDEAEFFGNIAVMSRVCRKENNCTYHYDVAGFDTLSGKRLFLFKNVKKPIIAANAMIISKVEKNINKAVYGLNGKCIIPFGKYDNISLLEFSTTMMPFVVTTKAGKYGICKMETGEEIIPNVCDNMFEFADAVILEANVGGKIRKGLFYGNGNFTGFVYDNIYNKNNYHYLCESFGSIKDCINTLTNQIESMR